MDSRVPLWFGVYLQQWVGWGPLLFIDFYESSDIFGTSIMLVACVLFLANYFRQKLKEHPKCKSRLQNTMAETCKLETTAEACFETKSFGGGRKRDSILSYVWDQIWQKLDKIALSNKKPALTTSSNQLTNKDINRWYVIAPALILFLGFSCILFASEMVLVNIFLSSPRWER